VKKWLLVGTLLGFGLLFFVLPILVGLALERGYPLVFDDLRERTEGRLVLEASLNRGLLDSTGETLIRMASPGLDTAPLRLRHAWAHGPLPLSEWWAGRIPVPPVLTVVRIEVDPEGIVGPEWLAALAGQPLAQAAASDARSKSIRVRAFLARAGPTMNSTTPRSPWNSAMLGFSVRPPSYPAYPRRSMCGAGTWNSRPGAGRADFTDSMGCSA
jgi:hypothetical protein